MRDATIIGADDAVTITDLLREVGKAPPTPPGLRDAAGYWAGAVEPGMEPGDLQTVAWLLRDLSAERRIPAIRRDQARYWAAYLEGRMAGLDDRMAG